MLCNDHSYDYIMWRKLKKVLEQVISYSIAIVYQFYRKYINFRIGWL